MSKILKIERQPWMPEWATHWGVDAHEDMFGLPPIHRCYKAVDGLLTYPSVGTVSDLWSHWDYVYEITEAL